MPQTWPKIVKNAFSQYLEAQRIFLGDCTRILWVIIHSLDNIMPKSGRLAYEDKKWLFSFMVKHGLPFNKSIFLKVIFSQLFYYHSICLAERIPKIYRLMYFTMLDFEI